MIRTPVLVASLALSCTLGAQSSDKPMPTRPGAAAVPAKGAKDARGALGKWSQWRGPRRDGHYIGPAWPARLEGKLEKLWTKKLGRSYSGPIVDASTVYTTESTEDRHERVLAFDRKTGERRWEMRWKGHMKVPFFANRNGSWIRSTPIVDESSVYVGGMPDILACIDKKTGNERWRIDLRKDLKMPGQAFGFVCSPLLDGKHLFVQTGGGLLKFEKDSGTLVWRGLRDNGNMMSGGAFSSPVVATVAGKRQLLVQTRVKLCGVDLDKGSELWGRKIKTFRGMNILTPLAIGNGIFTSAYGGRGHFFDIAAATDAGAATSDVSDEEGADFAVSERWNNRAQGYMTSPVEIDGHVYLYLRSKRFCCVEVASGKICWISEPIGDEYASLVANRDRVLALTNTGELYLIAHDPKKFNVIDRVEVADQETWAHLAVDGDQILIRELEALTAYRWR